MFSLDFEKWIKFILTVCYMTPVLLRALYYWLKECCEVFIFPNFMNKAHTIGIKKNPFFRDNFAPVHDELTVNHLTCIHGEIPKDINGMYIRNGPNPQFSPLFKLHWFEGDGHLHAIKFDNGKASYLNRYVQTPKFKQEKEEGRSLSLSALSGGATNPILQFLQHYLYDRLYTGLKERISTGVANTNIIMHGKRCLALEEGHLPIQIELPTLKTIGEFSMNGKYHFNMTAHPKIDPITKDLVFFGYNLTFQNPVVRYGVVNEENGDLIHYFELKELPYVTMIHDFEITENYTIIGFFPLILDLDSILQNKSPLTFDSSKKSYFAIFPRFYNENGSTTFTKDNKEIPNKIYWFEADPCYVFHYIHAKEEQDGKVIKLTCCRLDKFDMEMNPFNSTKENSSKPYVYTFNLETNQITEEFLKCKEVSKEGHVMNGELTTLPLGDFPVILNDFVGQPNNRYFYYSESSEECVFYMNNIIKVDLQELTFTKLNVRGNIGEISVIKKENWNVTDNQDDVYIVSFVYHAEQDISTFCIFDGKTMKEEPICQIELPRRVPYGFHGNFLPLGTSDLLVFD
ncbi:hypothetical protein ABK040_004686 [Willaertia magna]